MSNVFWLRVIAVIGLGFATCSSECPAVTSTWASAGASILLPSTCISIFRSVFHHRPCGNEGVASSQPRWLAILTGEQRHSSLRLAAGAHSGVEPRHARRRAGQGADFDCDGRWSSSVRARPLRICMAGHGMRRARIRIRNGRQRPVLPRITRALVLEVENMRTLFALMIGSSLQRSPGRRTRSHRADGTHGIYFERLLSRLSVRFGVVEPMSTLGTKRTYRSVCTAHVRFRG